MLRRQWASKAQLLMATLDELPDADAAAVRGKEYRVWHAHGNKRRDTLLAGCRAGHTGFACVAVVDLGQEVEVYPKVGKDKFSFKIGPTQIVTKRCSQLWRGERHQWEEPFFTLQLNHCSSIKIRSFHSSLVTKS